MPQEPQDTPDAAPEPSQARSARTRQRNTQAKAELLRQLNAEGDSKLARMSVRRLRYILEMIREGNMSEAARIAGFSEKYAAQIGWALYRNIEVRQAIKERIAATLAQPAATSNEVIRTVATMMRVDPADIAECFKEDGTIDWEMARERGVSKLIKKIRVRYYNGSREVSVEWHDPKDAAKVLGGWLGLNVAEMRNPADIAREERERDRNREWAENEVTRLCDELNRTREPEQQVTREQMVEIIRARGGALAAVLLGGEVEQMIEVDSIN